MQQCSGLVVAYRSDIWATHKVTYYKEDQTVIVCLSVIQWQGCHGQGKITEKQKFFQVKVQVQKFHTDDMSLPRPGLGHILSMEFLWSFLRHNFTGNQCVAKCQLFTQASLCQGVGCFSGNKLKWANFWQTAKRCQVVQSAPALRTPWWNRK